MKKTITKTLLTCALVLTGCGGGGGGGELFLSEAEKDTVERLLFAYNDWPRALLVNELNDANGASSVATGASCAEYFPISQEQLESSLDEVFENGACFSDYSICTYVNGTGLLEVYDSYKSIWVRQNSGGSYFEFRTYPSTPSIGIRAATTAPVDCETYDDDAVFQNPDGRFVGNAFYLDRNDPTREKTTLSFSESISMDCSDGICILDNENVIFTYNGQFDLRRYRIADGESETDSGTGNWIGTTIFAAEGFEPRRDHDGYRLHATVSRDGRIIAGTAVPLGYEDTLEECFDGGCFVLSFEKIEVDAEE